MPVEAIDDVRSRRSRSSAGCCDIDDIGDGVFAVRIALNVRDRRRRRRPAHEHAVRQYLDPRRRRAPRRRAAGRARRDLRRTAPRPRRAFAGGSVPDGARSPARRSSRRGFRRRSSPISRGASRDGGIDYIKDDHGLADQAYSPVRRARRRDRGGACAGSARPTVYVPSLSGDLDAMRAADQGRERRRHRHRDGRADDRRALERPPARARAIPSIAFLAHPALAGAAHGAAAAVRKDVPHARRRRGGLSQPWRALRLFARDLPRARRRPRAPTGTACKPALPVPAGGMTTDRVARDA